MNVHFEKDSVDSVGAQLPRTPFPLPPIPEDDAGELKMLCHLIVEARIVEHSEERRLDRKDPKETTANSPLEVRWIASRKEYRYKGTDRWIGEDLVDHIYAKLEDSAVAAPCRKA